MFEIINFLEKIQSYFKANFYTIYLYSSFFLLKRNFHK